VKKKIFLNPWLFVVAELIVSASIILSPWGPQNHSAEDTALVIGLPIVIFHTVVAYGMAWLFAFVISLVPKPQQAELPFSARSRIVQAFSLVGMILAVSFAVLIPLSIAILISSVLYPHLGLAWASEEARRVATWIFIVALLPIPLVVIFIGGIVVGLRFRAALSLAIEGMRPMLQFLRLLNSHP
jgi:hypothetical protein